MKISSKTESVIQSSASRFTGGVLLPQEFGKLEQVLSIDRSCLHCRPTLQSFSFITFRTFSAKEMSGQLYMYLLMTKILSTRETIGIEWNWPASWINSFFWLKMSLARMNFNVLWLQLEGKKLLLTVVCTFVVLVIKTTVVIEIACGDLFSEVIMMRDRVQISHSTNKLLL